MSERNKNDFFFSAGDEVLLGAIEWLAQAGQRDPLSRHSRPPPIKAESRPEKPQENHQDNRPPEKRPEKRPAKYQAKHQEKPSLKSPPLTPSHVPPSHIPPSHSPNVPPLTAPGNTQDNIKDNIKDNTKIAAQDNTKDTPKIAPASRPVPPKALPASAESDQGQAMRIATAAKTLDQLQQAIAAFDQCSLRDTATHTVFARGTEKPAIMMIGEAPGDEEDKQGKPFVGASGRLLDTIMTQINVNPDDVRIANILPWRPPGNRAPLPSEIALCLPFLERHIELARPKILVCLGGVAAKALLGRKEGITVLRRSWHHYENPRLQKPLPLKPTFHPAYLLRSPGQKRKSWQDFLEIRQRLSN